MTANKINYLYLETKQVLGFIDMRMHFFIFIALFTPFTLVFTAPTASDMFSSSIAARFVERRQIFAPRPLPIPPGQQSCSNNNTIPFYWRVVRGKRSKATVVRNEFEPTLSPASEALAPRKAGELPSPLCSMISYFAFTDLGTRGAITNSVKVYPGVQYVFSIGCDIAVVSVTTWYKNRDESDPLSEWDVLIVRDWHHSTTGTMTFEVHETTEVQFTVGFGYFGASGEVGLFQVNVPG